MKNKKLSLGTVVLLVTISAVLITHSVGCSKTSDGSDAYAGDVEDVAVTVQFANGGKGTFHLETGSGIMPAGTVAAVTLRLKQFQGKDFSLSQQLAQKTGLINGGGLSQGGLALSVGAARVQLRCNAGSTDVIALTPLKK